MMNRKTILRLVDMYWIDIGMILLLIALKVMLHGYNLNSFPYFENDEATYTIRAHSFQQDGSFDVYTYWYDHAPAGWMFIALWQILVMPLGFFANILVSARFFNFILTTFTVVLMYLISKQVMKNRFFAVTAAILFIVSPLSIYYQRRILLDNIMAFWMVLSLYFINKPKASVKQVFGSAVAFALSILTKLNAVFFAPGILYPLYVNSPKRTRKMKIVVWMGAAGSLLALFPLYALLKGELFPVNDDPASGAFDKGISLYDSLKYQSSRGQEIDVPFWEQGSNFMQAFNEWFSKDPLFIVLGVATLLSTFLLLRKTTRFSQSAHISIALAVAGFTAFLVRGGVVLEFYFIPLLALVAIGGVAFFQLPLRLNLIKTKTLRVFYAIVVITLLLVHQVIYIPGNPAFTRDENSNMFEAVEWVKDNVPKDAAIAADSYALIFLGFDEGYTRTDYNWKLEYDPDITYKIGEDWKNIDYILLTHEILKQARQGATPDIKQAILHSEEIVTFDQGSSSFNDFDNLISTNGDWVSVLKVKSDSEIVTQDTFANLLNESFMDYGRIVDSKDTQVTTSQIQSNAMLRALHEDNKDFFDGIWAWTRDHLQNRSTDTLISSEWSPVDDEFTEFEVSNSNSDTLADIEIAFALMSAANRWDNEAYHRSAQQILDDIWEFQVITRGSKLYLMPFSSAPIEQQPINLSTVALPYLEEFADYDESHEWSRLASDGLDAIADAQDPVTGLFRNWITVDSKGAIGDAEDFAGDYANVFSYEAFKIIHHLNESSSQQARPILQKYGRFMESLYESDEAIPAVLNQDGSAAFDFDDTIMYATAYLGLRSINSEYAPVVLRDRVLSQFIQDTGQWGVDGANISNRLWLSRFAVNTPDLVISNDIPEEWRPKSTSTSIDQ